MRRLAWLMFLMVAISASSVMAQDQPTQATAEFKTQVGETVGNATLTQNADGSVRLQVQVRALPPGQHGIHIHAVGTCAPDFAAAGGHYNPAGKKHGLENPEGPHAGDAPNLTIAADGTGSMDITTDRITLVPSDKTVFDADGSAIVIHAAMDDQKTDPAGNSGDRIACAVIQPVTAQAQPASPAVPTQLPATSGSARSWLTFGLVLLFLAAAGMLAWRRVRARD